MNRGMTLITLRHARPPRHDNFSYVDTGTAISKGCCRLVVVANMKICMQSLFVFLKGAPLLGCILTLIVQ